MLMPEIYPNLFIYTKTITSSKSKTRKGGASNMTAKKHATGRHWAIQEEEFQ